MQALWLRGKQMELDVEKVNYTLDTEDINEKIWHYTSHTDDKNCTRHNFMLHTDYKHLRTRVQVMCRPTWRRTSCFNCLIQCILNWRTDLLECGAMSLGWWLSTFLHNVGSRLMQTNVLLWYQAKLYLARQLTENLSNLTSRVPSC